MISFSVCIPTYSRLDYLKISVQSVLDQSYPQFELCIAQDPTPSGPSLPIQQWCTELAAQASNVRYQINQLNLGLAGNWNRLVQMATGEYVVILGDDDKLAPEYLEKMAGHIQKTGSDVCFCDQNFIDANGKTDEELTEQNRRIFGRLHLRKGLIAEPVKTVLQNTVPMSSSLTKRKWLMQYSFDPALNTPELEVFLKIALAGGTFYYEPKCLASYRVHNSSATSSGLTVHRLVSNIIDIDVPAQYEPYKKTFIEGQIRVAVNRYLQSGDKKNARRLLQSRYYTNRNGIYALAQKVLLLCPSVVTTALIKLLK